MGMSLIAYILMWTVMMGAMMLPSIAPLASRYVGLIETNWLAGAIAFTLGYLGVWAGTGVLAYGLSWLTGTIATGNQAIAVTIAAITFAACGLYQFSSVKQKCLDQCRAPFSLLLEYSSWQGPARHLRVGFHHGFFCLGCCAMLMVLMFVFGVMNIGAMMILTLVVAAEKVWGANYTFPRLVGVACFGLALAVLWFPQLAPGMIPSMTMINMGG
jgi:predicted metal-binding membrane protein